MTEEANPVCRCAPFLTKLKQNARDAALLGPQIRVLEAQFASAAYCGIETVAVELEADVSRRFFLCATVAGLPDIAPNIGIVGILSGG